MSFQVSVPRKRERNSLHLAQERGEMLKPQKFTSKKRKASKDRNAWKREDYGD